MSKLSLRHPSIVNREANGCSCQTCGRAFETPIRLTNLSASSLEVYNACPFCFAKQSEILEEREDPSAPTLRESVEATEKSPIDPKNPEQFECPHYVGYLKKRPKNSPIPEYCLTCQKMIQCLL